MLNIYGLYFEQGFESCYQVDLNQYLKLVELGLDGLLVKVLNLMGPVGDGTAAHRL
jgi:hypothetical protein